MNEEKKLKEALGEARKLKAEKEQERKRAISNLEKLVADGADQDKIENLKTEITSLRNEADLADLKIQEATDALIENGYDADWHKNGDIPAFIGQSKQKGGQALDEAGKIRMYHPGQSVAADQEPEIPEEFKNIGLGDYLRAMVQKPRTQAETQLIQNSVTSSGYELPVWIGSELIDQLRAINPLLRNGGAGARTIMLDGGTTKFIRLTGDPTAVWHAEMVDETPSDPSFDSVDFDPKTVLAMTEVSRELLQDSANVAEALTAAFTGSINQAVLDATFTGAGTADEPEGLSTVVTQTSEYANGGDPDWTNFVAASKQLHDANVPDENRSFIHSPGVWEDLALATDNNGRYQDAPSFIRNVPNFVTSGVSAGEAYAGDFTNVVYGMRLNISIERHDSYSASKYGTLWVAGMRLDIQTFRPSALVRIEEASA